MNKKEIRTRRKLERKKQAVLAWLKLRNIEFDDDVGHYDTLRKAYGLLGYTWKAKGFRTLAQIHAYYNVVMSGANIGATAAKGPKPKKRPRAEPKTQRVFYQSYEWKRARYEALKRNNGRCECCGAGAAQGSVLNVDHIKPLKFHWDMRLDLDNLQVLCGSCNQGKCNWDDTDWRQKDHLRSIIRENGD